MVRPGVRARVPVICVGNLTLGGAGKTPTAIAVAKLLLSEGARPIFLSRGYGGALAGPVRVTSHHRAADVGDEPLLLARVAPTIVARDRIQGAELAVAEGASVVVMDDGFQNPSLIKDRSLVVLDGERGIGNGRVFPAGPLRAPLDVQLAQATALLVIGDASAKASEVIARAQTRGLPVQHGSLAPDPRVHRGTGWQESPRLRWHRASGEIFRDAHGCRDCNASEARLCGPSSIHERRRPRVVGAGKARELIVVDDRKGFGTHAG